MARLTLMLLIALIAASCASTGERGESLLRQSVETFNDSFRLEDYEAASAFIAHNKLEQFWAEVDRFKGKIRLSDYELREVQSKGKGESGLAILHFQYWRPESPVLKSAIVTQRWYYSEKEKIWRLGDSGFGVIVGAR